jgi:hypothetical protein
LQQTLNGDESTNDERSTSDDIESQLHGGNISGFSIVKLMQNIRFIRDVQDKQSNAVGLLP